MMSDHEFRRTNRTPQPKYYPPPPVAVPRSQYANTVRPNAHRPIPGPDPPRYFSSPFRAPLNPQERQNSFVEHQKTISATHENDESLPRPHFAQEVERDSYTFFEHRSNIDAAHPSRRVGQEPSAKQQATDTSQSSRLPSSMVRQASTGRRVKPALTDVRRSDSTQTNKQYSEPKTPPTKPDTIDALNAAIAAAIKNAAHQSTTSSVSHNDSNTRVPCDSPTSTYSQDFRQLQKPQTKPKHIAMDYGRVTPLEEGLRTPSQAELDRSSPVSRPTPHSEKSMGSTNPLLGLAIKNPDVHSRVPEDMRPPRLNMKAVHDMESRGSITSLPDLIRRATRLAANLDRGKTASRLGMWDMFNNADHATAGKRESTFTDVLNAFPEPTNGTPSKVPRPTTMWPVDSEGATVMSEKENIPLKRSPRKCCGLSIVSFIVVTVIVIILIAAAIVIPIFLVAVPQQMRASGAGLGNCAASSPCQNGGISIVDNNACSCVCVNGFTGRDCSKPADQNCDTANLVNAGHTFENATLGRSVHALLVNAHNLPNIPLNVSIVLAVFANNNLSCAGENSLVEFNTARRRRDKQTLLPVPRNQRLSRRAPVAQTMQTSTGVVYQTTSSGSQSAQASVTTTPSSPTTAASETASSTTVPSAGASTTSIGNNTTTDKQRGFAGLVVLYVLAESRTPSTAVTAQSNIDQYLLAGGPASGNTSVDVVVRDKVQITANFQNLAIVLSDGKILGGSQ